MVVPFAAAPASACSAEPFGVFVFKFLQLSNSLDAVITSYCVCGGPCHFLKLCHSEALDSLESLISSRDSKLERCQSPKETKLVRVFCFLLYTFTTSDNSHLIYTSDAVDKTPGFSNSVEVVTSRAFTPCGYSCLRPLEGGISDRPCSACIDVSVLSEWGTEYTWEVRAW